MHTTDQCPHGHPIRSQADRSQGYCRVCKREGDRTMRRRKRPALEVVKALEGQGAVFQRDGVRSTPPK